MSKATPAPHPRSHTHSYSRPGRKSWSLAVWALAPPGPREFWVQSSPFLGSWDPGVAALSARPEPFSPQGQAVLGSPSHRSPSASSSPCCLGKLTAAQRPPSASDFGQSTARPPPPFARGLVTLEIFTPSSQRQPHACGAFSRVERKAGPATSGTPRGAPRPPPGEDLVEKDRLCVAYPEGAASRASEPPARTAPGTTPSCAHSGPGKRGWAGPSCV